MSASIAEEEKRKVTEWFKAPVVDMRAPKEVLDMAISEFKPVRVFACFSGGNDSQVSTHYAMQNEYAQEVFNINTGIGIPEAREHLYRTVDRFNWPLRVKTPPELNYEEMVMKFGFPGPGAHTYPYAWLKERAVEALIRETKRERSDKLMLVTGVRQLESARRMGYVEPVYKDGATIWVAPFYSYSRRERDAYMERHMLIRNPVTEKLGISGECLCGAYAAPGERKKLNRFYPEFDSYLAVLEARAKEAGQPYCEWGNGRRDDPNQGDLDFMPMCVNCIHKQNERETRA